MKALMIYGLKFGSDNSSLTALGEKIKALGVEVSFTHWDDKDIPLPDGDFCIVAHSFGVRPIFNLIESAPDHMTVFDRFRYIALIDPVADWFPLNFKNYWKKFDIPSNVAWADCFIRSWNIVPPSGSILNADGVRYCNFPNISASHADIPGAPIVVDRIISTIKGML